jgi:hypothetical protein
MFVGGHNLSEALPRIKPGGAWRAQNDVILLLASAEFG